MSKECQIKVYYQEHPTKNIIGTVNLFTIPNYDKLKNLILEKSKKLDDKKVKHKLKPKDKFILEPSEYEIGGLNAIWDSDTYKYFFDKIQQNPPNKIKFIIKKVDKYPKFVPPQEQLILSKTLETGWESIKKEIEDELTENYLNDGKRRFIQGKKENN